MADLLLRDLLATTGGRLTLASMPPRDGDLVMLRRSTAVASQVQCGDLYWALSGSGDDGMCHVEEAFARGAAGAVIAGRSVEPWPGKFTVATSDVRKVLWQAATQARARFQGAVIATDDSATARLLHRALSTQLSGSYAVPADNPCVLPGDAAAIGLLNAHPSHDYVIAGLPAGPSAQEVGERSCPHLLALVNAKSSSEVLSLLHCLPTNGCAVLNGDNPALRAAVAELRDDTLRIVWVGCQSNNEIVAAKVEHEKLSTSFSVDGHRIKLSCGSSVCAALAAIAVARILQISDLSLFAALGNLPTRQAQLTSASYRTLGAFGPGWMAVSEQTP